MNEEPKTIAVANAAAPEKPLCLKLEEATAELVAITNDFHKRKGIPFFMLEGIFADVSRQVAKLAATERENAKNAYNKQLEEYGKA